MVNAVWVPRLSPYVWNQAIKSILFRLILLIKHIFNWRVVSNPWAAFINVLAGQPIPLAIGLTVVGNNVTPITVTVAQ